LLDAIEDYFRAGNFDLFQILGEEEAANFATKSKEARSKLLSASGIDDLASQPWNFDFLEKLTVALLSDTRVAQVNKFGLIAERDGVIAERDVLIAERDVLIAERDVLIAERDIIKNSRTWRLLNVYRITRNLFR
jgi:methyl-accepting chemotaxis protein